MTGTKKAGDKITCVACQGRGYTLEGLTGDYPVECRRCGGSGTQTIASSRGGVSPSGKERGE